MISYSPFIPVIGNGKYQRQPVHVDDFCALILYYIYNELDMSKLDVVGSKAYTFIEIIKIIQKTLQRKSPILHIPKKVAQLIVKSKIFPNLEESLISTIDVSETFSIEPIVERISSLRSFDEGHVDLLS